MSKNRGKWEARKTEEEREGRQEESIQQANKYRNYRSLGNFCVKKYSCKMFVLKNFVLYDNLTHIQLRNVYVENISCLIFLPFDEYKEFFMPKISRIMVLIYLMHRLP